jgi:hypothetical protein
MKNKKELGGLYTLSNRHNHSIAGHKWLRHGSLVVPLQFDSIRKGIVRVLLGSGDSVWIPISYIGPKARL